MAVNIRLEWRHSLMVAPREEQWVGRNFTKTRRGSGPSVAARSTWIWKSPALLAHAEFLTASFLERRGSVFYYILDRHWGRTRSGWGAPGESLFCFGRREGSQKGCFGFLFRTTPFHDEEF